jgi:UDP-glucose 4-epimerase
MEVIAAVERAAGTKVAWSLGPRRPGDPSALYAAAGKAQHELGWTPRFSDLDTIVNTAAVWHRTHPTGYSSSSHP